MLHLTVRTRLIISYIAIFLAPTLITLVLLVSAALGLYTYARNGNHLMAESSFQFNAIAQGVHTAVFHYIRHSGIEADFAWAVELIDPVQNYVVVDQDGKPFYVYGNDKLAPAVRFLREKGIVDKVDRKKARSIFNMQENGAYYFLEKQEIQGHAYHLFLVSHEMPPGSDSAIEEAVRGTLKVLAGIFLFCLIGAAWFLSKFIITRITKPLVALERGAKKIKNGELDYRISYDRHDEFTPAIQSFNLMTAKLEESLLERERQDENRKELIASISHDIRTPLTVIKAYVEGLLDRVADTPEKQRQYLELISGKTNVLEDMIEQLFLLSKMDLGDRAVHMETVDLAKEVVRAVEEGRESWARDGGRLSLQLDGALPIKGNPLLISRILANLIGNSIKYKTAPETHITIACWEAYDHVHMTVTDDGPGVPEEALSRLTEAFYRTDKARSRTENGSGLGLAIVDRAVHMMGGSVQVKNAEPHGLEIQIVLPMA
ncbi:MAG: HAMP domain-containing sensor histidine kinase [Dialister sp.]|nr:HAMP domain-containing sensor histidine kinase [Dialister sp.]